MEDAPMMPRSLETVVVRPLQLALPAPPPPHPPPPPPPPPPPLDPLELFAAAFQHDVAALIASAFSPVRLRVLVALAQQGDASSVDGSSVAVTALARRLGEHPDKISGHLRTLRLTGLVGERPHGKERHYTADPSRIRLTRDITGGFALDLLARAGGRVMLTLRVLGDGQEGFATDGARMDTNQEGKKGTDADGAPVPEL
jgi:DNA-binding transcriptional ArsR family regulator